MHEIPPQSPTPLKDTLFTRIKEEQVCPHSRLFFRGREVIFWTLWLLSVVIGALAVAVTLFVLVSGQYAFYEATHENFFTFFVEVLPYVWITVFIAMSYGAVYQIRHTKRGYRYPLSMILASNAVLSFAGGVALHVVGFGYEIDESLGKHLSVYTSQMKLEERWWQDPADGRLVGRQIHATLAPTSTIVFQDVSGCQWTMYVSELSPVDIEILASGETVRILGKSTNEKLHLFHSCGVFPWTPGYPLSRAEMGARRQHFVEKIGVHAKQAEEYRLQLMGENFASTTIAAESICASLQPVRRFSER